jgi:hypothetical protein
MDANQSIDFTRGSLGLWALWICLGLGLGIGKQGFKGVRSIPTQIAVGFAISTVIVGALALWQGTHPKYFVRMRLLPEKVVLGFQWPAADKTIPLREIKNVSIFRYRSRGTHFRIQITTPSETYRSFGYSQLSSDELIVVDLLRGRVGGAGGATESGGQK